MRLITSSEFQNFVSEKEAAAIHFDAEWNQGRINTRHQMLVAERSFGNIVNFGEVDCDQELELAKSIPVLNVSLVAYYRHGKLVAALIGNGQNVSGRVERVLQGEPIGYNDGTDEPKMPRLSLIDSDPAIASALRAAFEPFSEVFVSHGDLLRGAHNAIVSPANSFGFMDGGIDAAYCRFFGPVIQERVQAAINTRPEGYLPVGASLIIETGHARIPFLIVAPTMLSPEAIDKINCYRAMRAILRVATADKRIWRVLFCPSLGTGVGQVAPDDAAAEMARAYGDWKIALS